MALPSAWPLRLVLAALSLAWGVSSILLDFTGSSGKTSSGSGEKPEVVCLFAFQAWRSYFLILAMMAMGSTISHLPIPKYIDAVIYFTMGSALCFGSSRYFREFSEEK